MALSEEILQNIAYAEKNGYHKQHLLPPAQTREMMKQAPKNPAPTPVGKVLDIRPAETGIPVRIYIPEGEGLFPLISYFHGGGFVLMSLDTHDELCRQLCVKSGAIVMSVDYLLAPEHPYPAGPDSSLAATKWMMQHAAEFGGIGERMAVAGDSAGGYMALYTAQKLAAEGITLKAQFAAYPVTDHYSAQHPSWQENKEGFILSAEMMAWFWDNFLQDSVQYEEASPLRTKDFSALAPAMIITANYDPLRDEGKAYADKLASAGVESHYRNYENVHGFFGVGPMGKEALQAAADFLKDKLNY